MPKDWKETESHDVGEDSTAESKSTGLNEAGKGAMQGEDSTGEQSLAPSTDQHKHLNQNPLGDPSKWEYRLGSPHADYQAYKDLQAAQRQHELGRQASTIEVGGSGEGAAGALIEAAVHTAAAKKEAQDSGETKMDEYFYLKYGRAPYTEAAYPEEEDE